VVFVVGEVTLDLGLADTIPEVGSVIAVKLGFLCLCLECITFSRVLILYLYKNSIF
jgi:hypothetical protein